MIRPRRAPITGVIAAMALIVASCSSSQTSATSTTSPSTTFHSPASIPDTVTLLSGIATVKAAQSFDDPGFHHSLSVEGVLPVDVDRVDMAGSTIVISLWDANRPDQTCDRDHPLSGCLTVDWSDAPGRPHVPASGVFDNRLTFSTQQGPHTLYLSEAGSLSAVPDQFSPG